jgi:hypothetical protein
MSPDVLEGEALREHQHLQVVEQLRDLFGGAVIGFVLGRHPHFGRLFDDLLADLVHAGVEVRDGAGALGPLNRGTGELLEQPVEGLHSPQGSGLVSVLPPPSTGSRRTITAFETGVLLSSDALAKGTSTFASG